MRGVREPRFHCTSRIMAADRPYSECCDFYRVSPEYFGWILVLLLFYGSIA
jgi:hypothetical protein